MAEKTEIKKAEKSKRTPKQRFKLFLKIILVIILIIAILFGVFAIINMIGNKSNANFISTIKPVEYENQLIPEEDENGVSTFVTDEKFKVMQLTDVHIGAGFMCFNKDTMALNTVSAMISQEKPDLVVVTGDIAYPVPFQAGTFNNKNSAKLFAELMEQLGVYWCLGFGNHDTELYSYYSREQMAEFYESDKYPHCLFNAGDENVDGYGNYAVNVKNSQGKITQSLMVMDSHSYVDGDFLGILWKYDTFHTNQVEWYENTLKNFQQQNGGEMPKSLVFFHIPTPEYRDAWYEYVDNGLKDTENVTYNYGKAGETGAVIYPSEHNYGFFDKASELGSTQGLFCGHDHYNNFSLNYKGINLNYGYSIDYLAYAGISKLGTQRGCTIIDINPDGTYESTLENYYQDKYKSTKAKEEVTMQPLDTITYEKD
ncbi:MAG: metallophosphoesterase [Acetobacter sp.]|nr:metallophosphoesterase [Bacteroides sp.]MCM1340427.1 metallophosphoesterase [Acetobacter sp.]MCM1432926.1 metallophosphoesterase [Clostridiales bacterium]